jgi:hypothetical protein
MFGQRLRARRTGSTKRYVRSRLVLRRQHSDAIAIMASSISRRLKRVKFRVFHRQCRSLFQTAWTFRPAYHGHQSCMTHPEKAWRAILAHQQFVYDQLRLPHRRLDADRRNCVGKDS